MSGPPCVDIEQHANCLVGTMHVKETHSGKQGSDSKKTNRLVHAEKRLP
jgi:hypothetical protein